MKVQNLIGNETGIRGELEAADFLRERGLKIIAANVSYKGIGEIDIVAMDGDTLAFVEVKTRENPDYDALFGITKSKMRKVTKCAEMYIADTKLDYKEIRFDVVAITVDKIEYIKNAFYGGWM